MSAQARSLTDFGALICDDYGVKCDCCERVVRRAARSLWTGPAAICFACLAVWYDSGETAPSEIKAKVLAAEQSRTYPFDRPTDAERVPY